MKKCQQGGKICNLLQKNLWTGWFVFLRRKNEHTRLWEYPDHKTTNRDRSHQSRPSVGTGATGAKAPVNFEQLVLGTPPENGIIQFGTRPAKLPTEGLWYIKTRFLKSYLLMKCMQQFLFIKFCYLELFMWWNSEVWWNNKWRHAPTGGCKDKGDDVNSILD